MRKFLPFLATLLPLPGLAANAFMPDASDLWWNPDESGWGMNIAQQGNVLFVTLFVYANDRSAHWYVVPDMRCPGAPTDVQMICSGDLYETTGPLVTSSPFNPAAVTRRVVGTAKFFYSRGNAGQIEYSVDGVTTSKNVRRQTWAVNDISGEFNGTRVTRPWLIGCSMPNVTTTQSLGRMTVTQSASALRIDTRQDSPAYSCTYTGDLTQAGRMSDSTGTYSCSDGTSGPYELREIEVSKRGFLGNLSAMQNGCRVYGNLGGARATVEQAPD